MAVEVTGRANPERGEMDVEIGGRVWRFRACTNQLIRLEEATGRRANEIESMFAQGTHNMADMRSLIWSLLTEHQPDVTLDECGDLMDQIGKLGPDRAHEIIASALKASSPDPEPSDADPPKPQRKRRTTRRRGGTGGARTGLRVDTE